MNASISQSPRSLPVWSSAALWLAVFLSPSAYFLLLAFWGSLQVPAPPVGFVAALFCVIPVVAVLVCARVIWLKQPAVWWRVGGLVLTMLAMALQVGCLLVIIRAILIARIANV